MCVYNNQDKYDKTGPHSKDRHATDPFYAARLSDTYWQDDVYAIYHWENKHDRKKILEIASSKAEDNQWQVVGGFKYVRELLELTHQDTAHLPPPKSCDVIEWAAPAPHLSRKERREQAIVRSKSYIESLDLSKADYCLLEFCCDKHSRLCSEKYTVTPKGGNCVLVRFTEDHDMTSSEGFDFACWVVAKLSKLPMIMWGALPCTAGCSWHRVNKSRAERGLLPDFFEKHARTWRDFRVLFKNFVDLSKLVQETVEYSRIAFEWPQFNDLWKNKQVRDWLASANLQEVCFNGCMV